MILHEDKKIFHSELPDLAYRDIPAVDSVEKSVTTLLSLVNLE